MKRHVWESCGEKRRIEVGLPYGQEGRSEDWGGWGKKFKARVLPDGAGGLQDRRGSQTQLVLFFALASHIVVTWPPLCSSNTLSSFWKTDNDDLVNLFPKANQSIYFGSLMVISVFKSLDDTISNNKLLLLVYLEAKKLLNFQTPCQFLFPKAKRANLSHIRRSDCFQSYHFSRI